VLETVARQVRSDAVRRSESLSDIETPCGVTANCQGWTDIFLYPPCEFLAVNALITNFHLPRSTLLMLVSALAGRELILRAYEEAIRKRYRFYSFGDAMLLV